MPKFAQHVEKNSQFLRNLVPIRPCEQIQFGLFDCFTLGFFFVAFIGLVCMLSR